MTQRPRTTLLTGGTGFVGANLARRLLHEGHRVHMLVREGHTGWRIEDIRRDVMLHTVDLADAERLSAVVRDLRPEWVFHLAAYGAYSEQSDRTRIFQTNVVGTVNLVEACLRTGVEALVNTGSSSEYGFKDHAPHEGETVEPNSYYAVSKASATMYCRYAAQRQGDRIPTLRLYSVYGPFEQPTRLIPTMIVRGLENTLPPLVDPHIARDFVFVEDVTDAYLRAASTAGGGPGAVYNVGSGVQTSIAELVEAVRTLMRIEEQPRWGSMQDREWDTRTWVADNRLISEALLWRPDTSLRQGLSKTIQWLQADSRMLRFYRDTASADR